MCPCSEEEQWGGGGGGGGGIKKGGRGEMNGYSQGDVFLSGINCRITIQTVHDGIADTADRN